MAINKEIFDGKNEEYEEKKAIEIGNIFPFGDKKYSEKMNVRYKDREGENKLVHFASYGIGVTRLLGTAVEIFHDNKGIIWPKSISPYDIHLIDLKKDDTKNFVKDVYQKLTSVGIDVLWDDRDVSAGEKFADADLIGIPVRLVISEKTGEKIEWKLRSGENNELLSLDEIVDRFTSDKYNGN
jgi:prolyl-tRNA synthetase